MGPHRRGGWHLFVFLFLGLAVPAAAQISGDIQVSASDASGATVPNADVTVRHLDTGMTRSAITGQDGIARVSQLPIGSYEVKIEAPGFAAYATRTTVNSGATVTVPVTLAIRAAAETITVEESVTPVNMVNAQLQLSASAASVVNLPLTGGNPLALAGTAPGIVPVTPRNPFLGLGSFNSNGGRGRGNNITIDNATATDVMATGSAGLGTVPVDAIKEFNLITNNFNAEFGRNSSAQVQILTKSGTNEFHGRAFEFFRNDKLNARDYFDRTGKPSVLRDNDWGVVAGGPLVKDRLFWLGTYEQQKTRGSGGTRTATVPRPDQVSGNIDPTAAQLLEMLQVPTDPSGTVTNPAPLGTNILSFSGRVDANLSGKDFLFARFGVSDSTQRNPGLTFLNSDLPTNGASAVSRPINATASETHAFGPTLVNELLASFGRLAGDFAPLFNLGGPEVLFRDGTSGFGMWSGLPQGRVQNTYQVLNTLSWIRGPHLLKFGGEVNRIQANSYLDANVRGTLTFLTLDDFLAGKPFAYTQRFGNSVRGNRVWNQFFFAQDDYRVTRRLTLNLGVRLEVAGGVTEVNDILSNLNLDKREALGGAGTGPLGGFDIGGSSYHRNWNWAPRFGFAWNPGGGKLSIRGGYGIAYDFIFLNPIANMRFLPPFMYQFALPSTGFTGANSFDNLVAGTSEFQRQGFATVGNFGTTIRNFGVISPVDQALRNPQVQQWSLTVERELPFGLVGRASYVGTKGNFLQRSRPINTLAPGQFTPPANLEEESQMRAAGVFTRINAGLIAPPTAFSNRIDPRFNLVSLVESSANSNYHSGQFHVSRRFARGYAFQATYTISKSIDDISDVLNVLAGDTPAQQNPFDNRNNRAVSQFDIPQRLVIVHQFEPQFTSQVDNPVLRHMVHGWMFSGIFHAQTGFPINLQSGSRAGLADPLLIGGGGQVRPNLVGPLNLKLEPNPGASSGNPNKVTGSGLAQPLVGHFGNLGRNVIRQNPLIQADWTVGKTFHISERFATQIQAHAFNVFNNTTFSRPGLQLSGPATFGYYADTDADTRQIMLALRFIW
jgi:hypothetical protein